jgi:hypothetical protein
VQIKARRGTVDVQIALDTLAGYNDNPGVIPGFGPVLADIARQIAFDQATNPAWHLNVTDNAGNLLHRSRIRDSVRNEIRSEIRRRFPTAADRAFVQARDRTCRHPGCNRKAIRCDEDHRLDHTKGGPSDPANMCCLCRHHHRFKHEKGFMIHPFGAGFFWESPDGRLFFAEPAGALTLVATHKDADGFFDADEGVPHQQARQFVPVSAHPAARDRQRDELSPVGSAGC